MSKIWTILTVMLLASIAAAASGAAASAARQPLLRDGFVLSGVDGTLVGSDSNDVWFFEFGSDVNDYKASVKAGTRLELLPSSGLEKMIADMKIRPAPTYSLWNGRVTKYKGKNYIFPSYFLPLRKAEKSPAQESPEPRKEQSGPADTSSEQEREPPPAGGEPNDALAIPQQIVEKLKARRQRIAETGQRIVDSNGVSVGEPAATAEEGKPPTARHYMLSADWILADRTALLVKRADGQLVVVLDAVGRNVPQVSVRLLPCETLELAELLQSAVPDPVRFKIAGLMTKYRGERFLLLHKAIRAYSHGNFGR